MSDDSTLSRIMRERRDKAAALREVGHNPYRNDFTPSDTCGEIRARYETTKPVEPAPGINAIDGESVRVAGRAMARRGFGKTVFVPIRDASGDMQLFINVDHLDARDFAEVVPHIDAGDIVGAEGPVFWTKRGEMSILCEKIAIVTKSLRPLPDKWHGLTDQETRYRQRYTDLAVNPEVGAVFRKRSEIIRGIRSYLDNLGFLEVETPMMHPIIGGAAARPFITHPNALDMQLFLRIAPELYLKRLLVGGFERVYEINRNFRNEGLSPKHNPEFTMLEFYQAYATYMDLMDLTEELISTLATQVNGTTTVTWEDIELRLEPPWKRLSVRDAVVELGGQSPAVFDDPVVAAQAAIACKMSPEAVLRLLLEALTAEQTAALGGFEALSAAFKDAGSRPDLARRIVDRYPHEGDARVRAGHIGYMIFDETVEHKLVQPTFLTDFPLAVSPLARKKESDPSLCDRFELFVNGKEIANAFTELNDPDDQRSRFLAQTLAKEQGADETMDYDEDYCRALEVGMPSAAGEGIGIDRLVMLLTGQSSIRDVLLFPLLRPE